MAQFELHKMAVVLCVNLPIAAITDRDSMTTSSARLVSLSFETNVLSFPAISNGGLQSIMTAITEMVFIKRII